MIPENPKVDLGINFPSKLRVNNIRCELTETGNNLAKKLLKTKKKYKWHRNNNYPLEIIVEFKELSDNIIYLKSGNGRSHAKARLVKRLNPKLAYLLGVMRDGSLMQICGMHWVRVYDKLDSSSIEKVIIPLFKEVYDVDLHLRRTRSEKYCEASNKPLLFQLKLIVGKLHEDVPEAIKNLDFEIVRYYIRGFFDAEGYVGKDKNVIVISQVNKDSLEFIKKTLERNGIGCGKIVGHRLPIYNKENLKKFFSKIGSSNQSKIDRLNNLLDTRSG